jgi:hypothetical protein
MKSVIRSRYRVVRRSGLVGTALALWIGQWSGEFDIRHSSRRILLLVPRVGANTGE